MAYCSTLHWRGYLSRDERACLALTYLLHTSIRVITYIPIYRPSSTSLTSQIQYQGRTAVTLHSISNPMQHARWHGMLMLHTMCGRVDTRRSRYRRQRLGGAHASAYPSKLYSGTVCRDHAHSPWPRLRCSACGMAQVWRARHHQTSTHTSTSKPLVPWGTSRWAPTTPRHEHLPT